MPSPEHSTGSKEAKKGFWERVGENVRNVSLVLAAINGIMNPYVILRWLVNAGNAIINPANLPAMLLAAGAGEIIRRISKAKDKKKH